MVHKYILGYTHTHTVAMKLEWAIQFLAFIPIHSHAVAMVLPGTVCGWCNLTPGTSNMKHLLFPGYEYLLWYRFPLLLGASTGILESKLLRAIVWEFITLITPTP